MDGGKRDYVPARLRRVFNEIFGGRFGNLSEMHGVFERILDGGDYYILCWDFESYAVAQEKIDECYKDQKEWQKRSILSCARAGKFSTDRTIDEYSKLIWYIFLLKLLGIGT